MTNTGILLAAVVAGLAGTPHCLAMCGGFAGACMESGRLWAWHSGRLTSYAVLGAASGAVGTALPGPTWVLPVVALGFLVWFSGVVAGVVPEPNVRIPGLSRLAGGPRGAQAPGYLFGVANGLLPCGLVYAALALPLSTGSVVAGAGIMVVFGLGTIPGLSLLATGLRRWVGDRRPRRLMVAGFVLVAGVWGIILRFAAHHGHGA